MRERWREQGRALAAALGLLTRIPMPHSASANPVAQGNALHWYPAAGALICLLLALAAAALPGDDLLRAALVVTLWTALTGALHLDGLADCADAWVGGMGNRQRTLAIMKDPACGPMGVTALLLALMLKVAALTSLLSHPAADCWWLAPLMARAALPLAFVTLPYVRLGGMGDRAAASFSRSGIALAVLLTLSLTACLLPTPLWWLWLAVTVGVFALWRRALLRRLGGFTGDGAGALVELLEVALLVTTALALSAATGMEGEVP